MNKLLAVIKAFSGAFTLSFSKKLMYKKLLAYGCIIGGMKYDGNSKDVSVDEWKPTNCWSNELPSIYELDLITNEMNAQSNDINKTFNLNISSWNRDEVRALMNMFNQLYDGYCRLNNKNLTLMETCKTLNDSIDLTFWQRFRLLLQLN